MDRVRVDRLTVLAAADLFFAGAGACLLADFLAIAGAGDALFSSCCCCCPCLEGPIVDSRMDARVVRRLPE